MTAAVAELENDVTEAAGPSEAQLLDVLYEVLAQGATPQGGKTAEAVERFLHEHARNKKSIPEILAFFGEQKLPTDASAYGADPALSELAQGFLRDRGPVSASFSLDDGQRLPAPSESGPVRRMEVTDNELAGEHTSPRVVVRPLAQPGRPWLAIAALACAALLGVAAVLSTRNARELEQKLTEARLQQRTTDMALTALERRAENFRGSLEQSEQARRSLSSRFDDFVEQEMHARAAEAVALERILGKRFEVMREQAMSDAQASNPR